MQMGTCETRRRFVTFTAYTIQTCAGKGNNQSLNLHDNNSVGTTVQSLAKANRQTKSRPKYLVTEPAPSPSRTFTLHPVVVICHTLPQKRNAQTTFQATAD